MYERDYIYGRLINNKNSYIKIDNDEIIISMYFSGNCHSV